MQQEQAGRFKQRGATVRKCLGMHVLGHGADPQISMTAEVVYIIMYTLCTCLQPPATGFAAGWWTAYKLFMHYPVDNIITESRDTFYAGDYEVQLVPLKPFPTEGCNFANFLGGVFELGNVRDMRLQESKMVLWARKDHTGRRIALAEPPLPVLNGVQRPHGAVLDFHKRPVPLVHDTALVKYLRYRGVRLSSPPSLVTTLTRRPPTPARTHTLPHSRTRTQGGHETSPDN